MAVFTIYDLMFYDSSVDIIISKCFIVVGVTIFYKNSISSYIKQMQDVITFIFESVHIYAH